MSIEGACCVSLYLCSYIYMRNENRKIEVINTDNSQGTENGDLYQIGEFKFGALDWYRDSILIP